MSDRDDTRKWWKTWIDGDRNLATLELCHDPIKLHLLDILRNSPKERTSRDANDALRIELDSFLNKEIQTQAVVEIELDRFLCDLLDPSEPWDRSLRHGYLLRRERDMIDQRRVTSDVFFTHYICDVHRRVLWGTYVFNTLISTFRIDEESDLLNVDDEPFLLDSEVSVGVVHPLEMQENDRNKWDEVFADYEIHGFEQLLRPIQHQIGPQDSHHKIRIPGTPSHERLGELGWRVHDRSHDAPFERRFKWCGYLEFAAIEDNGDEVVIHFQDTESGSLKPIQEVNSIALFESIRAAQQSMLSVD